MNKLLISPIKDIMKQNLVKVILKFKMILKSKWNSKSRKIFKKKIKFLRNRKLNKMNLNFQFKIKLTSLS